MQTMHTRVRGVKSLSQSRSLRHYVASFAGRCIRTGAVIAGMVAAPAIATPQDLIIKLPGQTATVVGQGGGWVTVNSQWYGPFNGANGADGQYGGTSGGGTAGQPGENGGSLTVIADTINVSGSFDFSGGRGGQGGDGGTSQDGNTGYNGAPGGNGGNGGTLSINGSTVNLSSPSGSVNGGNGGAGGGGGLAAGMCQPPDPSISGTAGHGAKAGNGGNAGGVIISRCLGSGYLGGFSADGGDGGTGGWGGFVAGAKSAESYGTPGNGADGGNGGNSGSVCPTDVLNYTLVVYPGDAGLGGGGGGATEECPLFGNIYGSDGEDGLPGGYGSCEVKCPKYLGSDCSNPSDIDCDSRIRASLLVGYCCPFLGEYVPACNAISNPIGTYYRLLPTGVARTLTIKMRADRIHEFRVVDTCTSPLNPNVQYCSNLANPGELAVLTFTQGANQVLYVQTGLEGPYGSFDLYVQCGGPEGANDCANATEIYCGFSITNGDMEGSNNTGLTACGDSTGYYAKWWKIKPGQNDTVTVNLARAGSYFADKVRLAVLRGTCESPTCINPLPEQNGSSASAQFTADGDWYYIVALTSRPDTLYNLSVNCTTPPVSTCASACPATCGETFTYGTNEIPGLTNDVSPCFTQTPADGRWLQLTVEPRSTIRASIGDWDLALYVGIAFYEQCGQTPIDCIMAGETVSLSYTNKTALPKTIYALFNSQEGVYHPYVSIECVESPVLSGGWQHMLALRGTGAVYGWGGNWDNMLGLSGGQNRLVPEGLLTGETLPAKAISANQYMSAAIMADGSIRTFGRNTDGQLGVGSTYAESSGPVIVMEQDGVTPFTSARVNNASIAVGQTHVAVVGNDSKVYSWGNNSWGALGDGVNAGSTNYPRYYPAPVKAAGGGDFQANIVELVSGQNNTLALLADGTVWGWGYGSWGALGQGGSSSAVAVQVKKTDDTPLTDVIDIAIGASNAYAVRSDGSLWAWGANSAYQLADGSTSTRYKAQPVKLDSTTNLTNVIEVRASSSSAMAVLKDGTLLAWGQNTDNNLGVSTSSSNPVEWPIPVVLPTNRLTSFELGGNGGAIFGSVFTETPVTGSSIGTRYGWGWNVPGSVGDNSTVDRPQPVVGNPLP